MKELERFLQVSYPTARQRFADLLDRLGLGDADPARSTTSSSTTPSSTTLSSTAQRPVLSERDAILRQLASGELSVDEAERRLQA
jgi:hypothetical protein